jgi:hypothetical protein
VKPLVVSVVLVLGLAAQSAMPVPAMAQEEPLLTVQVFHLQHISAREAAAAIEGRLSQNGSMTVRPAARRITVHDHAVVVADIEELIASIDRKPIRFRLRVDLLEGSDTEYSVPGLADVTRQLKEVYPFTSYRRVGLAEFAGEAGDSGTLVLDDEYRVHLTVNGQRLDNKPYGLPEKGVRLDVDPFVLERITDDQPPRRLIGSSMVLAQNQEVRIGVGSSESSTTGLVVIVTAVAVTER